ncbi:condensation domain-containing protein, partial [Luteibacter sp. PPL554]
EALPLTPNGKLDRAALPSPEGGDVVRRGYEPPQGEMEERLAALWGELLGVERVGRHDHFFELGGHSLLVIKLSMRMQRAFDVELPIADIFAGPVLRDMVARLRTCSQAHMPRIAPTQRHIPLPLTSAQQRLWFLDRLDATASSAYHLSASFRLRGEMDIATLQAALDAVTQRHDILRTRFPSVEGQPRQVVDASARVMVASHAWDDVAGRSMMEWIVEESERAFDLGSGPLIRISLLRIGDNEHVLVVVQHHIISDRWSIRLLAQELAHHYAIALGSDVPAVEPLRVQYGDYAVAQKAWQDTPAYMRQKAYWVEALRGAPELLALPTDRPRPTTQRYTGASVRVRLPETLTVDLRSLAQRCDGTPFMVLLSAWSVLMSRLSGQKDIVTGVPFANRRQEETEALIGFFANTLALRVDLGDGPGTSVLLRRVRQALMEAYAHAEVPFEHVVEALNPRRSMGHTPVFQTLMSWAEASAQDEARLPGLDVEAIALPTHTTQFDMMLSLVDRDDVVEGNLSYRTDLFDQATAIRFVAYLQRILEGMCASAEVPVERISILPPGERGSICEGIGKHAA